MARKKRFDYFESFTQISNYAVEFGTELVGYLEKCLEIQEKDGKRVHSSEVLSRLKELHAVEEASDSICHDIMENLVNEFVTPIEREDIVALTNELDAVVDGLDDVLQRMYMYNISYLSQEVIDLAHVALDACIAVHTACEKFEHFKKSKTIHEYIVKINDYEDEGDRVYIRAMHAIFSRAVQGEMIGENTLDALGLNALLSALEGVCDACEEVADTMAIVIVKNS